MHRVKSVLVCIVLAAGVALLLSLSLLCLQAEDSLRAVEHQITASLADLTLQAHELQQDVLKEVDVQASGIRKDAVGQIVGLRGDLAAQLGTTLAIADKRLGQALTMADSRSQEALQSIAGIRGDLAPTLKNVEALTGSTASLVADVKDTLDDVYPDFNSMVQSVEVASTQTAQTMETVRATAPKLAADVSGITADFHDATHNLDQRFFHPPPKNKKQKVLSFFANFEAVLIAALRGGAF